MFIRQLKECPEFIAGDACHLRELLNAKTDKRAYRYSLAHAIVKPGIKTKPHSLKTSEVYYILEGQGRMHIDHEAAEVGPGAVIDIPPHAVQCIENTGKGNLVFLCIVDPAWCPEDEEILK
ncbi:MAG: cupin domain-containing protein [Candidatus Omnitrophota bacterium]